MTITQIKEEMLAFTDFYGGDIPDTEAIKSAKTKKDLTEIINRHKYSMENMLCDAISNLEDFKKTLGLD